MDSTHSQQVPWMDWRGSVFCRDYRTWEACLLPRFIGLVGLRNLFRQRQRDHLKTVKYLPSQQSKIPDSFKLPWSDGVLKFSSLEVKKESGMLLSDIGGMSPFAIYRCAGRLNLFRQRQRDHVKTVTYLPSQQSKIPDSFKLPWSDGVKFSLLEVEKATSQAVMLPYHIIFFISM